MPQTGTLERFITAQKATFEDAYEQVQNGYKTSHWMWFVFPQLKELGRSETAKFYGIQNLGEATRYLQHSVLGTRLINISKVLLNLNGKTAHEIFGSPDDLKLQSCMTLFSLVPGADPVFGQVLDMYFAGNQDERTVEFLNL